MAEPKWIDPVMDRAAADVRTPSWRAALKWAGLAQLEATKSRMWLRMAAMPPGRGADLVDVIDLIAIEALISKEKSRPWTVRFLRSVPRALIALRRRLGVGGG